MTPPVRPPQHTLYGTSLNVQSCEALNPSIFPAYSLQAEEGDLKLTLEELINKFNITYRPPKFERVAFPTLSDTDRNDSSTTLIL